MLEKSTKQIPMMIVNTILFFVKQNYALDSAHLLKNIGVNTTLLEDKNASVDVYVIVQLIDEIIAQTGDVDFLFKLGAASKPFSLGILGYIMLHSHTVYEALKKLCKYHRLVSKRFNPTIEEKEGHLHLRLLGESSIEGDLFEMYITEIHFCALLSILNQIASEKIVPSQTFFKHSQPKHIESYYKTFGNEVYFNHHEIILVFEINALNIKTLYSDENLLTFFEREAKKYMNLEAKEGLSEKVSKQIILSIEELDFSLASVAKKVGLSARNLQIQLKEEQTSYVTLLMEVRKQLAAQYLKQGIEPSSVATFLGYNEVSSFSRAFKQWYGYSPITWLKGFANCQ